MLDLEYVNQVDRSFGRAEVVVVLVFLDFAAAAHAVELVVAGVGIADAYFELQVPVPAQDDAEP